MRVKNSAKNFDKSLISYPNNKYLLPLLHIIRGDKSKF